MKGRTIVLTLLLVCALTMAPFVVAHAQVGAPLKVWIFDRVGETGMQATRAAIEAWARETGNRVEITEHAFFELVNNLPISIPAGQGPDVFMITNNYLGPYVLGGLIAPLDAAIPAEELGAYMESALDAFKLDGHLVGVPLAADVNALVYNKALVPTPPESMAQLIEMAAEMERAGLFGFLFPVDQFWFSYPFFSGHGGYVFGWTGSGWNVDDIGFDEPAAVEGLSYIRDLVHVHRLMPADVTADVMNSLFSAGRAGMIVTNPTLIEMYRESGVDVGVAPIPRLDNGEAPKPFATFTGLAVNQRSSQKERAIELVRYLGERLPLELYRASSGNIPVRADLFDDPEVAANEELGAWMAQLAQSDPLPSVNEMNFVWGPAITAFQLAVHGNGDPQSVLAEAEAQIRLAIQEARE